MDKYQEFILQQVYRRSEWYPEKDKWDKLVKGFISEKTDRDNCGVFDFEKDIITIKQDEDISSTVYNQVIKKNYYENLVKSKIKRATICDHIDLENWWTDYLSGVEVTRDGKNWEELEYGTFLRGRIPEISRRHGPLGTGETGYRLSLDFSNRIKKVKFCFVCGLADDYIMDVVYVEGDKEKYYRKKAEEDRKAIISNAKIKVSTGDSLVNIYFAPCGENYKSTEIELYTNGNLMARYKVPEEQFFKSIEGLAYGSYTFILKQFDKEGKIIFQTDEMRFSISKPTRPYGLPSI